MARPRKSSQSGEEEVKVSRSGLKVPYSGKVGGNPYVIYATYKKEHEEYGRTLVLSFYAEYAARRMIDLLIGKDEYVPGIAGAREGIRTDTGIFVTSMKPGQIVELLHYPLSEQEAAWRDPLMEQSVMRLKYGTNYNGEKKAEDVEEIQEETETGELVTRTVRKPKEAKAPKEAREKKAKLDRTGLVTAGELAERLKLEARIFRGGLRALGLPKPEGGWHWPQAEAEEILKKVEKKLKDMGKKK
jgi:hypothetical protein